MPLPLSELLADLKERALYCEQPEGMLMLGFLSGIILQLEQRWPELRPYRNSIFKVASGLEQTNG